jgi:hypothetical protein
MKFSARVTALLLGAVAALTMAVPTAAQATADSRDFLQDTPMPGVLYQLRNQFHFECLAGKSNERVDIAHCNGGFNDQWWSLEPVAAPGFFRLRGLGTGKCMAIIRNGNVRMSSCVDSFDDQWWRLDPVAGGTQFMLFNHLRGVCLAAPTINGAARPFTCTPSFTDQWWTFVPR